MSEQKVSPLKEKPLRQAGQGVREQMFDFIIDNFALFLVAYMGLILSVIEWARYFYPEPPHPILFSFISLLLIVWAVYRGKKFAKKLKHMKLGRDGEILVGQTLDRLVVQGFYVLHDVPAVGKKGKRFNLDHVLVSSKGIFVVETKTRSKHTDGTDKIDADEGGIRVAGYYPEKNILLQPKAEADWLSEMLSRDTGRNIIARPILAFPGWWIEPSAQKFASKQGVLLVNPKALGQFIENEPEVLSKEDVDLYVSLLSAYERDFVDE